MIRDAQVSKAVWQSMSKENKTQIFYSLIDIMDVVDIQLKSEEFVKHITDLGITKVKYKDLMEWRLKDIIRDVERELDTIVIYNIRERSVQ